LDKMEGNEETIKDEATLHGLENINVVKIMNLTSIFSLFLNLLLGF